MIRNRQRVISNPIVTIGATAILAACVQSHQPSSTTVSTSHGAAPAGWTDRSRDHLTKALMSRGVPYSETILALSGLARAASEHKNARYDLGGYTQVFAGRRINARCSEVSVAISPDGVNQQVRLITTACADEAGALVADLNGKIGGRITSAPVSTAASATDDVQTPYGTVTRKQYRYYLSGQSYGNAEKIWGIPANKPLYVMIYEGGGTSCPGGLLHLFDPKLRKAVEIGNCSEEQHVVSADNTSLVIEFGSVEAGNLNTYTYSNGRISRRHGR